MKLQHEALLAIGRALRADGYRFIAPTPLTYRRVLSRPWPEGGDALREIFGWNRPFASKALGEPYHTLLERAGLREQLADGRWRSLVRFSSLGEMLFVHSGFPTDAPDAVFFGPDTYRFCRALEWIAGQDAGFLPRSVIDVGAGTGAGGMFAAKIFPGLERVILCDINDKALDFARLNAALNEVSGVEALHSDILSAVAGPADLIISNPPYLVDASERAYRHGGGNWGCDLAVRIVDQALSGLSDHGRLLLYTGSPIVRGVDMFLEQVTPLLRERTRAYRYEETDPDVFGEELDLAPYDQADRIATVVLYIKATDLIR